MIQMRATLVLALTLNELKALLGVSKQDPAVAQTFEYPPLSGYMMPR